ncbi:MAG: AMP-binding protein, partial [Actinomycetota bacterium]
MIFASPLPDVEIPEQLLTEVVLRHAADQPDKAALIDGPTGRVLTYGALADQVRRFAGGLAARGLGPGSVVALMAPNVPEYAVVFLGTAYAGAAITTINPTYTAAEVHHQLEDSGARLLVTIGMFLETARAGAEGTDVEELFTIDRVDDVRPVTELLGDPLATEVRVPLGTTV